VSPEAILVTEPEDAVLRKLATRLLTKTKWRLLCFSGLAQHYADLRLQELTFTNERMQYKASNHAAITQIWHTKNPVHSQAESRATTRAVVSFAKKEKNPVIHYLSSLYAAQASDGVAFEEAVDSCEATAEREEECHLWNERAIEESGCKFRIYRLPLILDDAAPGVHVWAQFIQLIRRFRQEIEDRIPRYFTANPLRISLPEKGTLNLASIDDVVKILEELATASDQQHLHYHVNPLQPLQLKDYCTVLAELTGVRLQIVFEQNEINLVDKLFGFKSERLLPYLNCKTVFSTEQARKHSVAAKLMESRLPIPNDAIQNVRSSAGCNGGLGKTDDWRSGFEQKQVLLSDGVALKYYVGGTGGQTIVLLNAYGQGFGYWAKFINAVRSRFRVILWIPHGNDWDTVGIKFATSQAVHADDLESILMQETISTCTLLAWCSGPKLALEYCSRYPQRVASMVFTSASFKGLPQHKSLETAYESNLEPLLETIERYPGEAEVVLEYLKGTLLAQDKEARNMEELGSLSNTQLQEALSAVNLSLQELVLEPFHAENVVAYARQMRDFWRYNFMPTLNAVKVPILFLGGDCDRIASQSLARVVAGMIPQAQYLEVQGGTHYIQYDQWDLLAQVVEDAVNSSSPLMLTHPWARVTVPAE
jgi:pimeloyl-ACP methyl ester carboxylesterase/nucleoside-diphosphate-sugar epimerase